MAVLSISNGKDGKEIVKILEAEVWKIDRYTTTLEDSNEVRSLNQEKFEEFRMLYPSAGRGSIRLFLTRYGANSKEWLVFYKKHKVAFTKIILDPDFMSVYAEESSKYLTYQDKMAIDYYPQHFEKSMKDLCKKLLEVDLRNNQCKDGGPLYYGFMRDILYRYLQYSKENRNAKSIDQLYAEYYREIKSMPDFILDAETPIAPTIPEIPCSKEIDPDYLIYDEMDRVEAHYSKLQGFLGNPHFERHYGDIFIDDYLFILGNPVREIEQKEIYQKWCRYAEEGFEGTVVCPEASKNLEFFHEFSIASIVFFCVFESNQEVEKNISLAFLNKSEVVIQLYDASLYPKYSKKYPQATILLAGIEEEDTLLDKTDDFMIDCYNRAKEKRYHK